MHNLAEAARTHWFYLVLPVLLGIAWSFHLTHPWSDQPRFGELTALFDWCLFVPFLYAICYRKMPKRAVAIRTVALMCGGLWIAGKIVPDSAETILAQWGWLRGVGLAMVALAEVAALITVLRIAFGSAPDPQELERQRMPPLVIKMILAEARFWRWVWSRLSGR